MFFINKSGNHVILDWKVNGYYSTRTTSPMQGFVRLRDCGTDRGCHKNAQPMFVNGTLINVAQALEDCNSDWARQLAIYAWLLGEEIGGNFVVAIDQLVCKPDHPRPTLRVAAHRTQIRKDHQWKIYQEAETLWEIVHSDHIFRDMTKEESQAKCQLLDGMSEVLKCDGSDKVKWFSQATRGY